MSEPDEPAENKGHVRSDSWLKQMLIALGILIPVILGLFYAAVSDTRPIDDSDLALEILTTDPEKNGYPYLRNLEVPNEDYSRISRLDKEFLAKRKRVLDEDFSDVIEKYEEDLHYMGLIQKLLVWQYDREAIWEQSYPELNAINALSKVRGFKAARYSLSGQVEEAMEETLSLIQLGHRLQDCDGTLIVSLQGIRIMRSGYLEMATLLAGGKLSAEQLAGLVPRLQELEPDSEAFKRIYKVEYVMIKDLIEKTISLEDDREMEELTSSIDYPALPVNWYTLQRFKTQALYATFLRELIADVDTYRKFGARPLTWLERDVKKHKFKTTLFPNSMGKIIVSLAAEAHSGINDLEARCRSEHRLLILQIAMLRFFLDEGAWPEDLNKLVPDYISAIPIDPMDGENLRFNPETLRIYSVGYDFVDSGGETEIEEQLRDRNEFVIRLTNGQDAEGN